MRVVFMGTPDFAVACLHSISRVHDVVGVFTQPDKPKGRGYELTPPPVKVVAKEKGYEVFQPVDIKSSEAYESLVGLKPDVIVVVAYGQILPEAVLDLPEYGCINVHASLLPRCRGASPVQWAIVTGEEYSGVTTMKMNGQLDAGDVIESKTFEVPLKDVASASVLHDELAVIGSELIVSTLKKLKSKMAEFTVQDDGKSSYAPLLTKKTGLIDWSLNARDIDCLVRGLNPVPCAYTTLNGKKLKIFAVKTIGGDLSDEIKNMPPGTVVEATGGKLSVKSGDALTGILQVQLEGKKRMAAGDFLRGQKLEKGTVLGG